MDVEETLVHAGELLGDRRRIRILVTLASGEAWPAGELACWAGVRPPTASHHLERLVAGGLLAVMPQGWHRCCRLASPAVLAPPGAPHSWRGSRQRDALKSRRTRYDHLAGPLRLHGLELAKPTGGSSAPPRGIASRRQGASGWPVFKWRAARHRDLPARSGLDRAAAALGGTAGQSYSPAAV